MYRKLAPRSDHPLHLGLTEAGMGAKGIVASAAGLSILLQEGIGDTIRVSLTPKPGGDRTEEVQVAQQILQSMGLRSFLPQVTACPGCGRTTSTFFQEMAEEIQDYLRDQMPVWKTRYTGVEELKRRGDGLRGQRPRRVKHADIGISLPGTCRGAQGARVRGRRAQAHRSRATPSSPSSSSSSTTTSRSATPARRADRTLTAIPLQVLSAEEDTPE